MRIATTRIYLLRKGIECVPSCGRHAFASVSALSLCRAGHSNSGLRVTEQLHLYDMPDGSSAYTPT